MLKPLQEPILTMKSLEIFQLKLQEDKQLYLGFLVIFQPKLEIEMLLYQVLLGCWPLDLKADDKSAMETFCERMIQWQEKAVREAKLRSTWTDPNSDYEGACQHYLRALLLGDECKTLRDDIAAAAAELAPAGALNSLTQTFLRMTTPGVPDLYQGADYWDFSLVDPDNRRPVDFDRRRATFSLDAQPAELMANWQDGRIKQWLIANTLKLRRAHPRLFTEGRYLPLKVEGEHAERVIAFARELDGHCVIVIAARLAYGLLGDSQTPQVPIERWGDTHVRLPDALSGKAMERLFDGMTVRPKQEGLSVPDVLQHLPFALLQLTMSSTGESER